MLPYSSHYTQIGRYEKGSAALSAETLFQLSDVLEVDVYYLMNGSLKSQAEAMNDKELIKLFKEISLLPEQEKFIFKEVIEALLLKTQIKNLSGPRT